jgi:hypothetical protein
MKTNYSKLEKNVQCKNSSAFALSLHLDFQLIMLFFIFLKKAKSRQGG